MRCVPCPALREAAERLVMGGAAVDAATGHVTLAATDKMDDGSTIRLRLTLDRRTGGAHFDFTGLGRPDVARHAFV